MDVVMMLAALPLLLFGGFALDAISRRDDDTDDEDDHDAPPADSGLPPFI